MTFSRPIAVLACLLGFSGVLMAALGAHAVPATEDPALYRSWQAASLLHLFHCVVLLLLAILIPARAGRMLLAASWMLLLGVLLFSGSIYTRILIGLENTGNLAPAGGFILLAAWLMLMLAMLRD